MEGGGLVVLLLSSLKSLTQLYSLTMDVHARLRTESHQDVTGAFPLGALLRAAHARTHARCPPLAPCLLACPPPAGARLPLVHVKPYLRNSTLNPPTPFAPHPPHPTHPPQAASTSGSSSPSPPAPTA